MSKHDFQEFTSLFYESLLNILPLLHSIQQTTQRTSLCDFSQLFFSSSFPSHSEKKKKDIIFQWTTLYIYKPKS